MKKNSSSSSSGFTLLELLIVVSILAVLATVVVIVINPTQILTRARDSNRLSELASLNKALQIAQVQGISFFGSPNTVYVSIPDSSSACSNLGLPPLPSGWSYACVSSSTYKDADSTGWIPINFSLLPSGSPLSSLPVDPINSTTNDYYYTYTTDSSNWELTALLESSDRHDQAINDGDAFPGVYSLGTSKGLTPATRDMGLVGYWKMDETSWTNDCSSTTVIDSSGNGNNGKSCPNGSGPTTLVAGKVGNAGVFDGSDDYINVASGSHTLGSDLSSVSVTAWVKKKSNNTVDGLVWHLNDGSSGSYRFLTIATGQIQYVLGKTTNGYSINASTISNTNWHFLVLTFDGATLRGYLDGSADGIDTTGIYTPTDGSTWIGAGNQGSSNYYGDAFIDDVRIYNRALSATEISAIYNATK